MNQRLSPDQRADLLAAQMTLEQKIVLFSPDPQQAIPELGIPGRREADGGTGITIATGAETTAFPAGLSLASTWDPDLARQFGEQGGREAWLTGYAGWAAPSLDSLRNPFHGRQWASLGEDPVLAGELAAAVTEGINSNEGVYSLPKHWLLNTQETQRRTLNNEISERALREFDVRQWEPMVAAGPGAVMCAFPKLRGTFSCENDHLLNDILKRDLDFPGWVSSDYNACYTFDSFTAGADVCGPEFPSQAQLLQAVTDGTIPADRFDDMVHRILRTFFERGLMDNPPPGSLQNPRPDADPLPGSVVDNGRELAYRIAVDGAVLLKNRSGALPLNTKKTRSVAVIGESADRYISGFGADFVRNPTSLTTVLDSITDRAPGRVQVSHTAGADPARVADLMPGAPPVPSGVLTPADGDGDGLTAQWYASPDFSGDPLVTRVEDQVNWGNGLAAVLALFGAEPSPAPKLPVQFLGIETPSIRWTGTLNPVTTGEYDLGFTVLGSVRMWVDDELVIDTSKDTISTVSTSLRLRAGEEYPVRIEYVADAPNQCCSDSQNLGPAIRFAWTPPSNLASPQIREAVQAAESADVAVVVANDYLGESLDRGHLGLPQAQDELITAVAEANPRTVVVLATGGAVEMPWLSKVGAVFEAWYPGQEQGRAVAALLFGDEKFTGKLPISWPKNQRQVTNGLGIPNPYPDVNKPGITVEHREGIYVGYRGYDREGLDPRFEFGYGLDNGKTRFSSLQVRDVRLANRSRPGRDGLVRVRVQNTGRSTTTETVQVYQGRLPGRTATPRRQLLGWAEVTLRAGQTRWVDIPVSPGSPSHPVSLYSTSRDDWVTPKGRVAIRVGTSLDETKLTGRLTIR